MADLAKKSVSKNLKLIDELFLVSYDLIDNMIVNDKLDRVL